MTGARTPDVSLLKTLSERAQTHPERTYVVDIEGRCLSYAQTVAQARIWASAYAHAGVASGDHVVTLQHNTIDSLLGWLGLAGLGAIEAPINTDYRGELLIHALNLTQARTIVAMSRFVDRIVEVAASLKHLTTVIVIDGEGQQDGSLRIIGRREFLEGGAQGMDLVLPAPWDIMAVLFTSGTTGPSKAVRLTWAQIHAMATGTFPLGDLGPDDVVWNPGPTYHVGAKTFPYIAALAGGRHVMRPFISRSTMGDEYLRFGVTTGGVVHEWLKEPERPDDADRPLRNILTPYRDPAADVFAKRFGCRRYGCFNMTEISCPITFRDWDAVVHDEAGRMSCGVLRPGYEARIVDAFDQPVPDGSPGELVLRAETPWVLNAGYLNNPTATVEAFRNGWFHTGDAFLRDAEGNFFFLDRIKDCIRRRGENISSFEVEAYVNSHPAVSRSAAVARRSSAHAGADEEIRVFIELLPGEQLDPEELIRWLIPQMPRFMIPRYVDLVEALPLTPTQKVQKKLLRERDIHESTWDREAAGIEVPR